MPAGENRRLQHDTRASCRPASREISLRSRARRGSGGGQPSVSVDVRGRESERLLTFGVLAAVGRCRGGVIFLFSPGKGRTVACGADDSSADSGGGAGAFSRDRMCPASAARGFACRQRRGRRPARSVSCRQTDDAGGAPVSRAFRAGPVCRAACSLFWQRGGTSAAIR